MTDKNDDVIIEEFEELPFDTGDPAMVMTIEDIKKDYPEQYAKAVEETDCVDCMDTGVIGNAERQTFCNCIEGDILKALAFGTPVEIKMMLYTCPKCSSERGRGRKYDGERKVIYCPDCKTETPRDF